VLLHVGLVIASISQSQYYHLYDVRYITQYSRNTDTANTCTVPNHSTAPPSVTTLGSNTAWDFMSLTYSLFVEQVSDTTDIHTAESYYHTDTNGTVVPNIVSQSSIPENNRNQYDHVIYTHLYCSVVLLLVCIPALSRSDRWYTLQLLKGVWLTIIMSACITSVAVYVGMSRSLCDAVCLHYMLSHLYTMYNMLNWKGWVKYAVSWPCTRYVYVVAIMLLFYWVRQAGPVHSDTLMFYSTHVGAVCLCMCVRAISLICILVTNVFSRFVVINDTD
jgi:hypothetical protein